MKTWDEISLARLAEGENKCDRVYRRHASCAALPPTRIDEGTIAVAMQPRIHSDERQSYVSVTLRGKE